VTEAGWRGQLQLSYRFDGQRTLSHDLHQGPLRVLQPLYPEGPGICHHVVVHPPGGVVGGDDLRIDASLGPDCHALVTTPGATRFYRSDGATAQQRAQLTLASGARLEWLPLETIAYSGCQAESAVCATLEPGAEMIGWDMLVLGLQAAGKPFEQGWLRQHLELPGRWLERGRIAADDLALRDAALGWAGRTVLGTAWFAAGCDLQPQRRERLLDDGRAVLADHALGASAGISSMHPGVVVLRVLAHRVESAWSLLTAVRAAWRRAAWDLAAEPPRIWRT
jgi:urease accessory protein